MNIATVLALLQAVLSLLSNPVTANNPQVQVLANQAVSLASVALAQLNSTPLGIAPLNSITIQSPTSTETPAPIVITVQPATVPSQPSQPQNIGAPDLGSVTQPIQPTSTPDTQTGGWECIDTQGFSVMGGGATPPCYGITTKYPPFRVEYEYKSPTGTVYYK